MDEGQADQADDRSVRWAYLVLLLIPLVSVVSLWTVVGVADPLTRVLYPMAVVTYGLLVVGFLARRLSLRAVGPWVLLSPTLILVARLLTWEMGLTPPPDNLGMVFTVLGWFGVVFALAFLVLGTRRGAIVSLLGLVVLYIWGAVSASHGVLAVSGARRQILEMGAAAAALIAVVWVLSRNIERLATVRARAELFELQAATDVLTGVANRRRLDDELDHLIAQARRYDQPLSVVLIDLDRFKDVNDAHGHNIGDRVLVETVDRLSAAVRDADLLGRWGGEEFLLLAPHTDHPAACALAERCRGAIARSPMRAGGVTMTGSFGVATLGPDDDARSLTRRADLALYTAKSEGRDRVVGLPEISSPDDAASSGQTNGTHGQV